MPLKLVRPRKGKTPYFAVRGTYLGKYIDRSTKTGKRAVAARILKQWQSEIERGEFPGEVRLTFASAALAYMQAGGERERMVKLLEYFGETPLSEIDQRRIDACAAELYPTQSAATRNRDVYTPVSAALKHAGVETKLRRPKGWRGTPRTRWLEKEQAFAVLKAADGIDPEFALFLRVLLYTGLRMGEALRLKTDDLNLSQNFAQAFNSKNGEVMGVHLPPFLVTALANHPRGLDRPEKKLFRFVKCGRLYTILRNVEKKSGVPNLTFHLWRHTWATWMRRFGGADIAGLLATQRWKDASSVRRYQHVVVSEEAMRADLLPVEIAGKRAGRRAK